MSERPSPAHSRRPKVGCVVTGKPSTVAPVSAAVDAYLQHLAESGLNLQVEGTIIAESVWPDAEQSLHDLGVLLRRLHEAGRTFRPPPDAEWMPWTLHSAEEGAIVSHGNVGPWHVVFVNDRLAGLSGWEYAGPVQPLDEVAVTAWYSVQLFDDDLAEMIGLPPPSTRARWYRAFLDGYGLPNDQRPGLIDRMLEFAIRDNGWFARIQGFTKESTDSVGLWTLAWQSRAALWTLEHRDLLTETATRQV